MWVKTLTLASLASGALAASSLSQAEDDKVVTTRTNLHGEQCDLRLWVRADDLTPSTIVEGDVRLLNNMTQLSPDAAEGCRILNWSLHLRHRERAAIQIPLKHAQLPKKPEYNNTWNEALRSRRRYRANKMLLEGADATSLFANKTDPYEEEKAAYYRALEEYVQTVQNADNWIVREDEATLFDVKQEAPASTLEVQESLQISMFPFGVAVPDVHFPEAKQNSMHWFSYSDAESARIQSNEEMDLSYIAEVHLANGSVVEVQGGKTKFFAPGGISSPERKRTSFILEEQPPSSDCSDIFAKVAGRCSEDDAKGAQEKSRLNLSGSFEAPATIRRGQKMHVQGSILWDEAMDDKYVLGTIRFDIQHRREKVWAVEQIEKAASATNRTKADVDDCRFTGCSSTWRVSCDQSESFSSALHVEEELKKYRNQLRRGSTKQAFSYYGGSCRDSELPMEAVTFTNGTSFELNVVPPRHLSSLRSSLFVKEELEWVITVDAKERRPAEELASQYSEKNPLADQERLSGQSIQQAFHNDTTHWTEYGDLPRRIDLLGAVAEADGEEDGASEKRTTFVARVPVADLINQEVQLRKRSSLLSQILVSQQQEDVGDCQTKRRKTLYYLEEGARAPVFVDISSDDKIREAVSLAAPCSSSQESFPLVDRTTRTTSHNPKDKLGATENNEGISAPSVFKYRKTKYGGSNQHMQDCKEGHGACGGGASDVGTVWANKVMLPKSKAVLRRETFQGSFRVHSGS